jgi:hypothetical protein
MMKKGRGRPPLSKREYADTPGQLQVVIDRVLERSYRYLVRECKIPVARAVRVGLALLALQLGSEDTELQAFVSSFFKEREDSR